METKELSKKTILNGHNIKLLEMMFQDTKTYEMHLTTIIQLREVVVHNIMIDTPQGLSVDINHPQWPAYNLLNNLAGALFQENYHISPECKLYKSNKNLTSEL